MKTLSEFKRYQANVERNLSHLDYVSTGACPGCEDCDDNPGAESPSFSWRRCEACGSSPGGDRHPAHGVDANGDIVHLRVCVDCLYFLNYGTLDDMTMLDMDMKS